MVTFLSDISLVQVTPQCAVGVPARPEAPSFRQRPCYHTTHYALHVFTLANDTVTAF